jgi:outer membrane biosynthesis protein TonB
MRTHDSLAKIRLTAAAALLAGLLAACGKPASTPAPDATPPSPTGDAPAPTLPPEQTTPPDAAPTAPAQPAPDAPPPTDPSPTPKPTSNEPPLESMKLAKSNAKIGVPVDLRYSVDGDALSGQPFVLHLAAVPRVAGANLEVSLKPVAGLQASIGTLNVQKASAAAVYRQQYAVTRLASGPSEIRVLVTMGVGSGSAFSWFSIPLDGGITAQKQDSVKLH